MLDIMLDDCAESKRVISSIRVYLGFVFDTLGFMVSGFCPEYYSRIFAQITFQGLGFTILYISSKHLKE